MIADVMVTSARTSSSVLDAGASLPLHGNHAIGGHHVKLDADDASHTLGAGSVY
jgi:hypothetical protein